MNRREFIRNAAALSGATVAPALAGDHGPAAAPSTARVAFVTTRDRAAAVVRAIAVPVKTTPVFSKGVPRELFDASQMSFPNSPVRNFDVSKDGKRFIMVQNTTAYARETWFNYIQNWLKEREEKIQ